MALFASVPTGAEALGRLQGRLGETWRFYHGAAHVAALWRRHVRFARAMAFTAADIRRIACAVAYHDAVYDPQRTDNEARSAELWREDAERAGLAADETAWVSDTILATADHLGPTQAAPDAARLWVLDLDLSPLAESPAGFARNTRLLRDEYAHLCDGDWVAGRMRFLQSLGRHSALFRTPLFSRVYEHRARRNIAAALRELRDQA